MVTLKYLIFIMISCVSVYSADESSYKLLTYNEIINLMQNLTKNYPNLIKYVLAYIYSSYHKNILK